MPNQHTFKDLTDQRFGRLTVQCYNHSDKHGRHYLCLCDCGNKSVVVGSSLRRGITRSCGCLMREQGQHIAAFKRTHGGYRTPEYQIWEAMKHRCYNPNNSRFKHYGGKGVIVCPAWHYFETFYQDMGPRPSAEHSIERRDFNGPYSPENCYWATHAEQSRNHSRNRHITHNGVTMVLTDWAAKVGIHYMTIHGRLKSGWSVEKALTTPPKSTRRKT